MKRLIVALFAAIVVQSSIAQTIGEAFYIYRNDGMINTFFRSEIDSMTYSYYDVDGVRYEEIVTQVVHTPDSTYRIPLAVIDSVGFVTPETRYQPGVIKLEGNIRNYIIGSDSLTVFFRIDTPSDLLPKVGDKLVTTEMSETFVGGFLGQVETREQRGDTIALGCSRIGLEEAFECFYYSTNGEYQNDANHAGSRGNYKYYAPDPFVYSYTSFLNANIKAADVPFKFSPKLDVTIAPSMLGKGSIIVDPIKGIVVSMDIKHHTTFMEDWAFTGALEASHDFPAIHFPVYVIMPLVWIYGELGAFVRTEGKLAIEQQWKQSLSYNIHYEVSYNPILTIMTPMPRLKIYGVNLSSEHDGQCMVDGYGAGGVYGELGIEVLSKDIISTAFRFEYGSKLGGNAILSNSDGKSALVSPSIYEKFNSAKLYLDHFCKLGLQSILMPAGKADINVVEGEWNLAKFKLVPDFSNTILTRDTSNPYLLNASTTASGGSLFTSNLGFCLLEGDSKDGIATVNYNKYFSGTIKYNDSFEIPSLKKTYKVYPTVDILGLGFPMLALPSAVCLSNLFAITLDISEITDKTALANGRIDGIGSAKEKLTVGIGYRKKGATGITLMDTSKINKDGTFSVLLQGLEPNTTYYYFAYIIVNDETNERIEGEEKEFTTKVKGTEVSCPDGNHPHMIDLGLPSGTKWACCNVGASTPEQHGGFYAWGETEEKSDYILDNYKWNDGGKWCTFTKYCTNDYNGKVDNKTEIETSDDVAYVKWGTSWRMPTKEQLQELVNNCASTWDTYNGMEGRFFTGPNNNKIFLPAAGYKDESGLREKNEYGYYWSNSLNLDDNDYVYDLYFCCGKGIYFSDLGGRWEGHSVRPVVSTSDPIPDPVPTDAEAYAVLIDGMLTFYYDDKIDDYDGNAYKMVFFHNEELNYSGVGYRNDMPVDEIKKAVFDESFKNCVPTTTASMFKGWINLQEIKGIEFLNTSNVDDMSKMFNGCSSLTNINLKSFDTANVTNMTGMFNGCSSLLDIDLSCFDTSNVTDMSSMFCNCWSIRSLDLSSFNTSKVTNMYRMFCNLTSLIDINLRSFITSSLVYMSYMFAQSNSLKTLDLSSFRTPNVTSFAYMFMDCSSIISIDISNFETLKVDSFEGMFNNCTSLTTIYANGDWNKDNSIIVKDYTETWKRELFIGCQKLSGGAGSKHSDYLMYYGDDGMYWDGLRFAHVDGGKDNPGFFTAK